MIRPQIIIAAALFIGSAFFYQPMDYDNTKSRYMLLSAVVDRGSLAIDPYQEYTIDKAFSGGHYYSIKPIGLPLLSVPFYWVLRHWFLGSSAEIGGASYAIDAAGKYLVRLCTVSLPFALLGIILFQFLLNFGAPARNAFWTVLAYSFGTISLNHATIFSGHQTAAFFLFSSFVVLYFESRKEASPEGRSAALGLLAGLCAGLAVLCDYLVAVYAVVLAWYALSSRMGWKAKAAFVAGASLCAAALGVYDQACFGSPFSTGYSHLAFEPFREYTARGLFGISWPRPAALWGLLFSVSRGILFISPVLLFSLAGLVFLHRRPQQRREFWVLAGIPAAAVILYSGYPGWHGGWSFGPRYLVPVLPFLAVPMALAADGGPWFQLVFWLSIFQVGCAQIGCPHVSQEIRNPIVEFMLPLMREGGTSLSLLGGARPGAAAAGAAQYFIIAALAFLGLRRLPRPRRRRLPWRWRAAAGAWAACVVLGLAFLRTADQRVVHRYRATILNDTAAALRSMELERAAQVESSQAR